MIKVNSLILMSKQRIVFCICTACLISLLIVACGPVDVNPTPQTSSTTEAQEPAVSNADSAYPVATRVVDNSGYPAQPTAVSQVGDGYPGSEVAPDPNIPTFQFDLPLTANMTTVTGKTPPNLSIVLVDVTFAGTILGSTVSDAQGNFAFEVPSLPEGHRVGLTFNSAEEGESIQQKADELFPYRGEEFMNIPSVGIFFETTMVQP
jgi:hypothetical protein